MDNKLLPFIILLSIGVCYLSYMQIKDLKGALNGVKKDTANILVVNSLLKDKLNIKDKEIEERNFQITKYNANFEAFNGTACMQCHLDSDRLFPYPNKELVLEDYIKVVRQGIQGVMPSYIDSPRKGSRDITDSELRRQFKILKSLESTLHTTQGG
ncbi:hypothetical protein [Helicobacter bilis]|uniref:hypothetical protein n=1 Tax=Helicobacter bilis TaxID=37372 RepID=UPI0025A9BE51|nr:hypothetical protein [Helicobacter bilis]